MEFFLMKQNMNNNMCRACLSTVEEKFISIDEDFVNAYNVLTNLHIMLADDLPQLVCQTCLNNVISFTKFRDNCISSEATLQEIKLKDIKNEVDVQPQEGSSFSYGHDTENIKIEMNQDDDVEAYLECQLDNFDEDVSYFIKKENLYDENPKRSQRIKEKQKYLKSFAETKENVKTNDKTKRSQKFKEKIKSSAETKIKVEKFPCGLCTNSFTDKTLLSTHLEQHRKDNSRCDICFKIFTTWPRLLAHRIKHTTSKQTQCHLCPKRCMTVPSMECHYLLKHYEEEFKGIQCTQCSVMYKSLNKLRKHVYYKHPKRTFQCDKCEKILRNKSALSMHILKEHTEEKAYCCDQCDYSTKYIGGLKEHITRRHTATKTYCKKCSRPFVDQKHLEKHKCSVQCIVCPVCGKLFSLTNKLTRHLKSHRAAPHKCDRCPAVLKTKYAFKVHMDRHENNRTKECEYCHAKFFSISVLIKHRRIHTGEKPYVCKVCNKGFTGNNNLKVHMKVHGEDLVVKRNKEPNDTNVLPLDLWGLRHGAKQVI